MKTNSPWPILGFDLFIIYSFFYLLRLISFVLWSSLTWLNVSSINKIKIVFSFWQHVEAQGRAELSGPKSLASSKALTPCVPVWLCCLHHTSIASPRDVTWLPTCGQHHVDGCEFCFWPFFFLVPSPLCLNNISTSNSISDPFWHHTTRNLEID